MKTSILLLMTILFGLQITVQNSKYIYLEKSERIEKLNVSGKFIGLSLYDVNNTDRKGVLYDTTGNKLFEYRAETGRIKNFLPNEKNNQVIIINEHWQNNQTDMDEIISYDINNKSIMWKTKALGKYYKMSYDGKYLLTAHHNEDSDLTQEPMLIIINLETGNFLPLNDNYTSFIADWYDSSRIIIYTREFELVKNEQFTDNFTMYADAIDSISKVRAKLYSNLKSGDISKDEYETTLLHLNNDEEDFIVSKRKQLAKQGMPYTSTVREYRLIRYNILTNQIEMEKKFTKGENITSLAQQIFIGKYLGENNVSVYLKETRNKLHKLDSNFNLIWTVEQEFPFYRIIENDCMYFVTFEKQSDAYKLITNNGQKQILSKTNDIIVKIQKNKLENSDDIDLRGNFSFDKPNNRIILSKE